MNIWFHKTAIAALAAGAACLCSSPAFARPTVRGLAAQELRLATIAYRIAAANADACPKGEIVSGLVLHDLTRYDHAVRPDISRAFSLATGFGVIGIVPGSVGAEAGLQIDDEIVAVGGVSVADAAAGDRRKSYDRMEQFNAVLQEALKDGATELSVRRGINLLRVRLRAQHGCGGKLALKSSTTLNAWADGKHVIVTTGMNNLARNDHEIAFVIAHEMAHNILGHTHKGKRGIFGFGRIKRGELEADGYAVRLMARAGYEPAGGISFLQSARRKLWWSVSLDHPGFGQRINAVATVMRDTQPRPSQNALQPTASQIIVAAASTSERPPLYSPIRSWKAQAGNR